MRLCSHKKSNITWTIYLYFRHIERERGWKFLFKSFTFIYQWKSQIWHPGRTVNGDFSDLPCTASWVFGCTLPRMTESDPIKLVTFPSKTLLNFLYFIYFYPNITIFVLLWPEEGRIHRIVPGLNEKGLCWNFFVCFISFVTKNSVTHSPLVPVTRDTMPFVRPPRDPNRVKSRNFLKGLTSCPTPHWVHCVSSDRLNCFVLSFRSLWFCRSKVSWLMTSPLLTYLLRVPKHLLGGIRKLGFIGYSFLF